MSNGFNEAGRVRNLFDNAQRQSLDVRQSLRNEVPDPSRPLFDSLLDPTTGQLRSGLQIQSQDSILPQLRRDIGGTQGDLAALEALRGRATGTDPSIFAQLQLERQREEQAGGLESAAAQSEAAEAEAFSRLASTGGAGSGARERLARRSSLDKLLQRQEIGRSGEKIRSGIRAEDERQRLGIQKGLAQRGLQAGQLLGQQASVEQGRDLQREQFNVQNALQETQRRRASEQDTFNAALQARIAKQQADALERSALGN